MVSNHSTHTVLRTLKPARLPKACVSQNPIGARPLGRFNVLYSMVSNHSTHTVSRTLKPARLPRACVSQNPIGARPLGRFNVLYSMVSNHSTHTVSRTLKPARLPRACMSQNPIGARLCDPRSMFIRSIPPAWTDTYPMNSRSTNIRWKNHSGKRWMTGRMSRRDENMSISRPVFGHFANQLRRRIDENLFIAHTFSP